MASQWPPSVAATLSCHSNWLGAATRVSAASARNTDPPSSRSRSLMRVCPTVPQSPLARRGVTPGRSRTSGCRATWQARCQPGLGETRMFSPMTWACGCRNRDRCAKPQSDVFFLTCLVFQDLGREACVMHECRAVRLFVLSIPQDVQVGGRSGRPYFFVAIFTFDMILRTGAGLPASSHGSMKFQFVSPSSLSGSSR